MSTKAQGVAAPLDRTTQLAYDRTRLAYERTMQAWIRTATSLITFGFGIYKLVDAVDSSQQRRVGTHQLGLALVCTGLCALALATVQHRQDIRALEAEYGSSRRSLSVFFAGLVATLGIFALVVMLFRPRGI
jgi:putative membrane protein